MSKFIEAIHEDGEKAFINLNLVSSIKIVDNRYVLNLYGNKYFTPIDCKEVRELVVKD
jgi:hypothetical protein